MTQLKDGAAEIPQGSELAIVRDATATTTIHVGDA
jgi:hypothetical protein